VEDRLDLPRQPPGHHRLRDPVRDRWSPKDPRSTAMRLGDLHRPPRRREVAPRGHPVPDLVQLVLQIRLEVLKRAPVHPRRAPIGLPRLPGFLHLPLRDRQRLARRHQRVHPALPDPARLPDQPPPQMTRPLPPPPFQGVHRYYGPVRQRTPRRYSVPHRVGRLGRSLSPPPRGRMPYRATPSHVPRRSRRPGSRRLPAGHRLASQRPPPGSSQSSEDSPGFDVVSMFSTPQQRSPSWSPPDTSTGAFSTSLTTTIFSQHSMWWFEASPRRTAPKGQTFISHAAPHQEALLHQAPSPFLAHLQP
jgi:hypothetical protein